MKVNNDTILIKLPAKLKDHINEFYKDKGGVSANVRKFLVRSSQYKPAQK